MTQREEFEAWLNPGHHAGNVSAWVEPGRYEKETHQLAWLAWQAAQPAQNHVWLVYNKVASMYFWSEDAARKAATFSGSLCMDVARIDLLDVPAQPAQHTAAIKTLEHLGYTYHGAEYWKPPLGKRPAKPEGWKLVPVEPTEAMWSELARDIVFWLYATRSPHYGSKLHEFLRNCGTTIPDWLTKEIPDVDHTPPKGTVAVCIYKAMLSAAPSTKEDV